MAKIRKVFLDNLPKWGKEGRGNYGTVNWSNSIGHKVPFMYDNIEGEIEIVDYNSKKQRLTIKYLEKDVFEINTGSFTNCNMGELLNKKTNEFKVEVGKMFKDKKRDLIIIDREYRKEEGGINRKWYKYKCSKCGYDEGWMDEYNILKGKGCSCCHGLTIVEGINDIPTTAPWMVKFFQGGYNEAKMYGRGSAQKIKPVCPDCGRVKDKEIAISTIYRCKGIGCSCGDGKSYPEKFMFSLLEKLCIDFKSELNNSNFDWCDKYRYDFYFEFNNEDYIIETHGLQHYKDCNRSKVKNVQKNDRIKKELALQNGIKEDNYIVVNCRESDMNFIKNNILKSKINNIFNLNNVDWLKVEEFALSNRVKEACEYKKNNPDMTTTEIGEIMKLNRGAIIKYLKKGNELGWCNYSTEEENKKTSINNGIRNKILLSKPVEIFSKNGSSLGIFESLSELERQSIKLFGDKLIASAISRVCTGKTDNHKGYVFKYVTKEEYKLRISI